MTDLKVLSLKEAADRYGAKVNTFRIWSTRGVLPTPDAVVAGRTPVWRYQTMDRFAKKKGLEVVDPGPYNIEEETA